MVSIVMICVTSTTGNQGKPMNVAEHHQARIRKVCEFIQHNLDESISLEQLSAVAACSKYHFHRIFQSFMGVSTMQYVQLSRMKRASFRLAFEPKRTITEIAFEASFDSPEAFSRAFLRRFGQTPSQFRSCPEWQSWYAHYEFNPPMNGDMNMEVKIVNFEQKPVALIEHRGHSQRVLEAAAKFIAWRKETGLSPVKKSETYGVPYSDPANTPEEDFRFEICGTHVGEVPENTYGVKQGSIPGGRCAVVRHLGSHDRISETVYYLYRQWLPSSGEELRDFPCFFHYLNLIHEVDECELMTDIYLPLK